MANTLKPTNLDLSAMTDKFFTDHESIGALHDFIAASEEEQGETIYEWLLEAGYVDVLSDAIHRDPRVLCNAHPPDTPAPTESKHKYDNLDDLVRWLADNTEINKLMDFDTWTFDSPEEAIQWFIADEEAEVFNDHSRKENIEVVFYGCGPLKGNTEAVNEWIKNRHDDADSDTACGYPASGDDEIEGYLKEFWKDHLK